MTILLKGIGRYTGDGWKNQTIEGETVFVYSREMPKPFRAGQFQRVGNLGWTASIRQYDFRPASLLETIRLLPTMFRDHAPRTRTSHD